MPFVGDDLVAPLATDLRRTELMQLGWVEVPLPASGRRCAAGSAAIADIGGQSFILGTEENVSVIAMLTGIPRRSRRRRALGRSGRAAASARSG